MMYAIKHRQTCKVHAIVSDSMVLIVTGSVKSTVIEGTAAQMEVFLVAGTPFPTWEFYADPIAELPTRLTERGI